MTEILKTATKRRRKAKVKLITVTNVFIGLCAILQFFFCFKKIITKLFADEKSTDHIRYPIVITLPLFATIKSAMFFCIWNTILYKRVMF